MGIQRRPFSMRDPTSMGIAVGLPTAVFLAHAARYGFWIVDDAGITFAYARSIAEGHGLVQQPGAETVEGYSNPLWLLLHVVGHWLGLFDRGSILGVPDYVAFPKALGVGCFVGILATTETAARAVVRPAWAVTAIVGLGLAVNPSFVVWSVSGLENPLYGLLAALLAALLIRATVNGWLLTPRAALAASAIGVLAALTRPDGVVLAAAYPVLAVVLVRRETVRDTARSIGVAVLGFAVPFGLFLVWRFLTFGRLVPNTAVAKAQGVPSLTDLAKIGDLVAYPGPLIAIVAAAVIGHATARSRPAQLALLSGAVPLLLTLLAYGALEQDWMGQHRFATPFWVLASMTTGLALVHIAVEAKPRPRLGLAALLAMALVPSSVILLDHMRSFGRAPTVPLCLVTDRFGRLYNDIADRLGLPAGQGSLLLPDIGGTLLTSRLTVIDLAGLTDPTIADGYHDGDIDKVRDHIFDEVRPTFIHTHGAWTALGATNDPRLQSDYLQLTDTDWVRKDATADGDATDEVTALRQSIAHQVHQIETTTYQTSPRRPCGTRLR